VAEKKVAATAHAVATPIHAEAAPTHAEIARLAYRLWSERGRPHGNDRQDWLRAEQELKKGK